MNTVEGKQAFLQKRVADAGSAAMVADGETPAADITDRISLAQNIDGARTENGDRAVLVAKRTLQRDQAVGFDIRGGEGQTTLYVMHGIADIMSGHTDDRLGGGNALRIEARLFKGGAGGSADIGERGFRVGQDIGGAGLAAPENAPICRCHGSPAARPASVDSYQVICHEYLRPLRIPKKYQ
ncbi:hypothetical protein D9M70_540570 [compost metagenome]